VRLGAFVVWVATALSACGGSDEPASQQDGGGAPASQEPIDISGRSEISGVGQSIGGSVAPLAQCRDWRGGTTAERLATIEDIRGQLTPQTSPNERSGYPDREAYKLFERICAQEYASAYRLYKLYTQAAAFAPLQDQSGD
jgi:hypothetical protein